MANYAAAADISYLPVPGKVAFTGNSLTMYNCGVDNVVKSLGDSMASPFRLSINQQMQVYGSTLQDRWTDANRSIIRTGGFNMVVLQEGGDLTYAKSPSNLPQFCQYAKIWADTIRATGATPVLYMMWAWRDDTGSTMLSMTNHQADEYDSVARLIHAKVIPVGRGYYKLRNDTSAVAKSINLFLDYQHALPCATYFTGCICFSALYNVSPVGNRYIGAGTACESRGPIPTPEQAAYMQQLAWSTWQQYGGADSGRGYVAPTTIRKDNAAMRGELRQTKQPLRVFGLGSSATALGTWYTISGARISTMPAPRISCGRRTNGVHLLVSRSNRSVAYARI